MTNGQSDSSNQQLLITLTQAVAELVQSNQQQVQKLDILTNQSASHNNKLEILTDQIGHLTESIVDLKNTINDGFSQLDERLNRIAATAEQQSETAKQQAESITRLIALLERK
jgi:methyl-accepting chemotaxis protein